jgi:hypothetical protein
MGIRVLNIMVSVQDVEFKRIIKVRPLVRLLWAHLAIHIHDELLLVTQEHAPLVNDFNPLRILRQGNRVLDDNVNLMRHALDA